MSDKEQLTMLIDIYTDTPFYSELNLLKTVKAKLEAFGIVTEELDIH